jgi:hypothetical protein
MGNRAVVTVKGSKVGLYLHWNGGRESVQAFLRAAKDLGVRDPVNDASYFYSRFAQVVSNFFGGTTCVGLEALSELDCVNGDNGVFVVGEGFKILSGVRSTVANPKQYEQEVYEATMQVNRPLLRERYKYDCALESALNEGHLNG